jgi:hypothetical protein
LPLNTFYFCLAILTNEGKNQIFLDTEKELHSFDILSNMNISLFHNSNLLANARAIFWKGMICSNLFIVPNFNLVLGKKFVYSFDLSIFKPIFPFLNISRNQTIYFEIDECKSGEVFDGVSCIPCPLNTYSLKKNLTGSILQCTPCTDQDNY